jgi:serine/threonine-protein kinase
MLDQFIGKTLSDKYKIEDILREDGTGRIYRGTHLLMEKPMTLKVLPPALAADENNVRRFSAEARTLSLVSHPNILNVTDFGSDKNGAIYIALENADGETVKDVLRREGKFSPERAVRIALQMRAPARLTINLPLTLTEFWRQDSVSV